ncbi:DUF2913 family protein [Yersinia enterocolitica]|uniref:DUF2913 family protein n=1 Tax=Yersinia enterocolitica TaxID=630 RepID=UPI001C60B95B|nr:DUF2913 family protein [Yersinia enterocolitica]MBW5823220.1 DUF2913 family protein [Yersinia enterocolitica]MBW5853040.1 DUF2913 family protein [Yersinia enterocolitica]MBW5870441.1 DUF2913 family protein [Yersinia enterocolitica]MBW5879424.1 DUF2913 family protein [Yersinia enterocolitica]
MDKPTQELGHLAWCLLVALQLAKQDGKAQTPMNQHLFIMQWLANAQKQKRFPKSVAIDIQWLLNQGKTYGFGANLKEKVDYLYRSCTGVLKDQSDLFRLTYALEVVKATGWKYILLSDKLWKDMAGCSLAVTAVYIQQSQLDACFNDDGHQIAPLAMRFVGNAVALTNVFAECDLPLHLHGDAIVGFQDAILQMGNMDEGKK